ncbi:MAG: R.Pab1 family restriction endonuclease [Campylobacter sp.]|nr:R.Pab1 family restriction endonuclease [Campylobacter sp.]
MSQDTRFENGLIFLPINTPRGKIRVKQRSNIEYIGKIVLKAESCDINICKDNFYFEWQISYGTRDNRIELSNIIEYAIQNKIISHEELKNLINIIYSNNIFIDQINIVRTFVTQRNINNIYFDELLTYPILIYKFPNSNGILCEIIIDKMQKGSGIMPMLYFCIPFNLTDEFQNNQNERCLQIDKSNIQIFVKMFQIFGLLSKAHKHDCLEILNYILGGTQ